MFLDDLVTFGKKPQNLLRRLRKQYMEIIDLVLLADRIEVFYGMTFDLSSNNQGSGNSALLTTSIKNPESDFCEL